MKLFRTVMLASTSLLAMTATARADFIVTPFLALASFLGVSGTQLAITALTIGVSVAQAALGRRGQKTDPGQYKNTFETVEGSEVNAIGRVRLGGLKLYGNTAGFNRYRLIAHCKGPLVAIEDWRLGGREVIVESNGNVSSPPYARPNGSYIQVFSKFGTGSETAWSQLMSEFPTLWTSAHRVRGVAQSLIRYVSPGVYTEKFGKLYQGGEPELEITGRYNRVYDPRDGSQSINDSNTWKWSDNGILCAARIMLNYPELNTTSFDWDFLADEADKADALVPTLTGTEPRSRCSGVWLSEDGRGDTMQLVLDSIGAEIVQSDSGLVRIRLIDDTPVSEIAFTANHINEFSWRSGPEAVERPNVCRVRYYSSERGYEMADITLYSRADNGVFSGPAWSYIEDEVLRYGEKPFDLDLPFCPSASQAQRIARRKFGLARANAGTIRTNMAGIAAWGLTYATIEDFDCKENMLCQISPPRVDDENGEVEIPYLVWPSLPLWNPATMEAAAPDIVPDLQYESEVPTPAAPEAYAVVQFSDSTYETRCRFAGVAGGTIAEAVYRTYSAGEPNAWQSMTELKGLDNKYYAYNAANTVGLHCEFKCRFFNDDEEGSYFSDVLDVPSAAISNAAPAAPTLIVDVDNSGSPVWFDVDAVPHAMNVVRVLIEKRSATGGPFDSWSTVTNNVKTRPAAATSGTFSQTRGVNDTNVEIRASAFSSNGTQGPYSTFSYTITGTGGG